jgi:lysyl-tRNA synthetase, class II
MAEDQTAARKAKLELLVQGGQGPYPDRWARTHSLAEVRALPEGTGSVSVAGRVRQQRKISRKLVFLTLEDRSGPLQVSLRAGTLPDASLELLTRALDLGDFLGVEGSVWVTRTGEVTLDAERAVVLAKALRPPPDKWAGLQDRELAYRQRYLDLMSNEETRERFRLRARLVRAVRAFLDAHGFEEVETPVLEAKPSGALARPFTTHHNALDMDLTLRIAPETWLKRLVVGGYERVYEFARCFRNEGMDPSHLQDFTMLEFYVAYWSYEENMAFTREMLQHVVEECLGTLRVRRPGPDGTEVEVDFGGEWPRHPLARLVLDETGLDVAEVRDADALRRWVREHGLPHEGTDRMSWASLVDHVYKRTVRPKLVQPAFVTSHPIELSPLARRSDADPRTTDRFQLLVNGWEVVNAYSELVDPEDQRRRFEEQAAARAAGDEEAMPLDEDYLVAMEHGMPPMSGFGLGVDRLVTLLSGQENLRDAVLFPLMRPSGGLPQ